MPLVPGSTLGPYRIIEPLGKGGMAAVYKAYEAALDRYVALKVLPGEFLHDENFAERFRREAKVIARLEHPHIIPIHAFGIDEGIPWMAMRLIAGGPLSSLIHGKRIPPARVATLLRGVAEALDYAHGKGVVHRDVKPQNVLLDEAERVYLADFGIARILEGSAALTQTGMISGTPQYMAPEQAMGQTVDHRVDIYALGIVAYEMLMGRVPFTADTPVAVLIKHVQEPMPLPGATEIAEPVARALLKSVAKKPEDRWPTATAFIDAMNSGVAESPSLPGVSATGSIAALPLSAIAAHPPTVAHSRPAMMPPPPPRPVPPMAPPPPVPMAAPPPRAKPPIGLVAGAIGVVLVLGAGYYLTSRPAGPGTAGAPSASPTATAGPVAPAREAKATTAPSASAPTAEATRLAVDFEHHFRSGNMKVWVDEKLALDQRLGGRVVALKLHKGRLGEAVEVSPGQHTIRVQVQWDDNVRTESITGAFRSGSTRRLEVQVGRIRKNLTLEWS